jgi:Ser/Thr protein kinase RdoA (MazF antagonist)
LIDLDKAGQGTAMLDIAITICKLCILDLMEYKYATKNQKSIIRIKQKYIQSFLKSYLKHRYLTDEERNMLMHGIKYGFLMNAIDLDSQTLKITWNDYQMLCQMATIV